MGWVSEEEIPKELALVLRTMEVGTISPRFVGFRYYHFRLAR